MHLSSKPDGKILFQQWNFPTIVVFKDQYKTAPFNADLGRLPLVPNAYSPFSEQIQSTRAQDLAIKFKTTRTQDLIVEAQAEQESFANRTRERIKYEVG